MLVTWGDFRGMCLLSVSACGAVDNPSVVRALAASPLGRTTRNSAGSQAWSACGSRSGLTGCRLAADCTLRSQADTSHASPASEERPSKRHKSVAGTDWTNRQFGPVFFALRASSFQLALELLEFSAPRDGAVLSVLRASPRLFSDGNAQSSLRIRLSKAQSSQVLTQLQCPPSGRFATQFPWDDLSTARQRWDRACRAFIRHVVLFGR